MKPEQLDRANPEPYSLMLEAEDPAWPAGAEAGFEGFGDAVWLAMARRLAL